MNINHIPTGKRHDQIWDVNTKLATGTKNASLEAREGTSYQSGCTITDHLCLQMLIIQQEYTPVEIEQLREFGLL